MTGGQVNMPLNEIRSRNPNLTLSEMEQLIATMIRRHRREGPIPAGLISFNTGLPDRAVRNIIRDLVVEHGLPIGSVCANDKPGFYWITNPEELKRAADRHICFGITNIVRGYRLLRRNRDELIGQLEAALDE